MQKITRPKRVELIRLLQRKSGADLNVITKALEWQPHSVRSAISGLRKSGYMIDRTDPAKPGYGAVYRITRKPENAR